ncbi:uncharacterized protein LOC127497001 [Ctenopharyngodon idella]|uniref:uncharacterized protein LOC127497001 n=1 Tax=Ctenopharyngodon idella TaxID=7959 RepID=UPI0022311C3C|nr:uncharacterized protein LOC127497001 [Ctenopharyngodon idella]XP_051721022.1 uncharacterized protein LOC127497001 [Ctenopharyngodon idella]XP_051721023.1 uncharacterized protein LOC127497001 [Ctenopharyngodon idella]
MMHQNAREFIGTRFEGQHLSLSDLKEKPNIENGYMYGKNIPAYPESVEFHIQKVSHVTGEQGLRGIFLNSGFRQPSELVANDQHHFLWWALSVTSDDISSAEERFLKSLFPRQSPAQIHNQTPVLEHFTSSKAFQKESSYGNFCFTFSFKELLWHYGEQFGGGQSPVLRVYETMLYKKEIQYTVVVHPRYVNIYDHYPRLPNHGDGVCGYSGGAMWWRCQSPAEAYKNELEVNSFEGSVSVSPHHKIYYVWDHVCIAFHMEPGWVLHVDQDRLFKRVNVCEMCKPYLLRGPDTKLSLHEAEIILADLKAGVWS